MDNRLSADALTLFAPAGTIGLANYQYGSAITAGMSLRIHDERREYVATGTGRIKPCHGSFDNDIKVVAGALACMRGAIRIARVENFANQPRLRLFPLTSGFHAGHARRRTKKVRPKYPLSDKDEPQ